MAPQHRYHLYTAYACPFACHALTARNLKGLQDVVGLSVVHPIMQRTRPEDPCDMSRGWAFVDPNKPSITVDGVRYSTAGCSTDPIHGAKFIRDLYELECTESLSFGVPLLWDTEEDGIVSNDSADLIRIFNSGFGHLASKKIDLAPVELRAELNAVNNHVVQSAASSFFKLFFAQDAATFKAENAKFFKILVVAEEMLGKQRYMVGQSITEADIRFFHSLIFVDASQLPHCKQSFADFPNIVNVSSKPPAHESSRWIG